MRRLSTQWPVNRFVRSTLPRHTLRADAFAAFGTRSTVVPPAVIEGANHIVVGDDVLVMEHARLTAARASASPPRLVLGDRVRLARFATVVATSEVVIEAEVSTSDNVVVTDDWACGLVAGATPPPPPGRPTVVERGAYLGCNSIVLPGVRIGAGAFVGEGAVVSDDVAPRSVVYGSPALVVRRFDAATRAWLEHADR